MSLDEDTVTYDDSAIAGPRMTTNPSDAMAPSFRGANRVAGLGQTDKVLLPPLNIKEEEVLTKDEGTATSTLFWTKFRAFSQLHPTPPRCVSCSTWCFGY